MLFASKAVWDLWRAPDKRRWWRWGWADFAASIPEVEALRGLRLLRLLLIVRVMRSTTQSVHSIATYAAGLREQPEHTTEDRISALERIAAGERA